MVLAGIPGTSPPTGLLGVGLGGDSTPWMTALQLRLLNLYVGRALNRLETPIRGTYRYNTKSGECGTH